MESALIYQFYEKGIPLQEKTKNGQENMSYECKRCKKNIHAIRSIYFSNH